MSELYNRIENLCKENGITITTMCKEANVSRGSLTDLKAGRSKKLSTEAVSKLAEYFEVSTDFILRGTEQGEKTTDDDLKFALYGTTAVDNEVLDDVKRYAEIARRMHEEKKNKG